MDDLDGLMRPPKPNALRPLLGQTVLTVEDSRYASEAIRLMCLRSGARIRRADTISAARRHLAAYRPSVIIVDLGLPDGSGLSLIEELAQAEPRVTALLATSGDDGAGDAAQAAGADAFLAKPVASLAAFQSAILGQLPQEAHPAGPRKLPEEDIVPDAIAFRDDLAHAVEALAAGEIDYSAQFLSSVARSMGDAELMQETRRLAQGNGRQDVARLDMFLRARMTDRMAV